MLLKPLANEVRGNDVLRRCCVSRLDGETLLNENELWFQFPKTVNAPESDDCDSYLLAMLMDGMLEGRNIVIKGSVSRKLLSNLTEFQSALNKRSLNMYKIVQMEADTIKEDGTSVPGAVCAFSGGVDATFSVWRNSQNKNSYRSQKINFCSLVHGFDIPLSDVKAFDNALTAASKTLSDINLEIIPIRTNYRKITKVNWEHGCGAALVGTLSNFKRLAGTCLVGSSEPYDSLVMPWGSCPLTDHLLSSDGFTVIHDGASHNRTEKVNEIADWITGVNNLRVCWQGHLKDRNCGKCEKCLRTSLNFLACNQPIPKCFPESIVMEKELKHIVLGNDLVRAEWNQILEYANRNNINSNWKMALSRVVRRKSAIDIILPRGSMRRKLIKNLIKRK